MTVLYLIHFEEPYHHARHYLGFSKFNNANRRFAEHVKGQGGPLTRAVVAAGIKLILAAVWEGDRPLERRWKRQSHMKRRCPVCMTEWRERTADGVQGVEKARK
jgi:hypothetical protein